MKQTTHCWCFFAVLVVLSTTLIAVTSAQNSEPSPELKPIFTIADPINDERGQYPKADPYHPWRGHFDMSGFSVAHNPATGITHFTITMGTPISNSWNGAHGFSLQLVQIYIDKDGIAKGPGSTKSLNNANVAFEKDFEWDYLITIDGWRKSAINSDESEIRNHNLQVSSSGKKINIKIDFGEAPTADWTYVVLMGAEDFAKFREFTVIASDWQFGGGHASTIDPNVVDIFMPAGDAEDTLTQEDALSSYCLVRNSYAILPAIGPQLPKLTKSTIDQIKSCERELARLSGELPGEPSRYVISKVSEQYWGLEVDIELDETIKIEEGLVDEKLRELVDAKILKMMVYYETESRINVKIFDPTKGRWEVPHVKTITEQDSSRKRPHHLQYHTSLNKEKFGFSIQRHTQNGTVCDVLFNTTTPLKHERKGGWFPGLLWKASTGSSPVSYIELSTKLEHSHEHSYPFPHLYGIGQRSGNLHLKTDGYQLYTLFNRDRDEILPDKALSGSHPFYMEVRNNQAHGVLLVNSNAMDIVSSRKSLTYKVTGGILDFYFFLGPTPEEVVKQYQELVGKPALVPYWALGFHQSSDSYLRIEHIENTLNAYDAFRMPLDTIWASPKHYQDNGMVFTANYNNFPLDKFRTLVVDLHDHEQQLILSAQPNVRAISDHAIFVEGKQSHVLIKEYSNSKPYYGRASSHGPTAFIDFTHPNASHFWRTWVSRFHAMVPFDGLMLTENELFNYCNGRCPMDLDLPSDGSNCNCRTKTNFDEDTPFYLPGGEPLDTRTISMTARHWEGPEYNIHNINGHLQSMLTYEAIAKLTNKRPFVISRSTFTGSGRYAGAWFEENASTMGSMAASIPEMLSMNIFGIPLVGSTICGYHGNSDGELCSRWMQLGAFSPLSRNHNAQDAQPQEPYTFNEYVANNSRTALLTRYRLLPYYYTLFMDAHINGGTVVRPLFFEFIEDQEAAVIETQFMIGSALMLTPVLTRLPSVQGYFPLASWYNFFSGAKVTNYNDLVAERRSWRGTYIQLNTPLHIINLFLRGGKIVPTQLPSLTTKATRRNPFEMVVALDQSGFAEGKLLVDDGESLDSVEKGRYTELQMTAGWNYGAGHFFSKVLRSGYSPLKHAVIQKVIFYGFEIDDISRLLVCYRSKSIPHSDIHYKSDTQVLTIRVHKHKLTEDLLISLQTGVERCPAELAQWELISIFVICLIILLGIYMLFNPRIPKRGSRLSHTD